MLENFRVLAESVCGLMLCENVFTLRGFSIASGSTLYAFEAREWRKLTPGREVGGDTKIGGGFGFREDVRGGKIVGFVYGFVDTEASE